MSNKVLVEVCAGSVEDCIAAEAAGADRIELNNAVFMGGLTPSIGTVTEALAAVDIPIITMVRPRGGGFCYSEVEVETMRADALAMIEAGVSGLVFGFLNEDSTVNKDLTKEFVELCHKNGVEAIFHRAFDRTQDPISAIESLIELKVDRVLTSGLKATAIEAVDLLAELKKNYGDNIEFCLGSGVNINNVEELIDKTGIRQVHASFKSWKKDPTTSGAFVTYEYNKAGDYEISDEEKIRAVVEKTSQL